MSFLRILLYVIALLSILPFLQPRSLTAKASIWVGKLVAGALAPILGTASGLGGMLGLIRRDWKMAAVGAVGAAMSARFVRDLPDSRIKFSVAFGPEWEAQIPVSQRPHLATRRWSLPARSPRGVTWQRNVEYGQSPNTGPNMEPGTGTKLLADLWGPPPGVPPTGLVAIYVHGGAWRVGAKDMGTRPFFRRLAAQGHVVMDIDYTLWPNGDIPNMVAEVKQAVLWMKENAADYGVNPECIVLMGGSAGGHLALLAAYTPDHPKLPPLSGPGDASVRGVVAFYPVAQLVGRWMQTGTPEPKGFADALTAQADRAAEGCLARMFMLHSGDLEQDLALHDLVPTVLGGRPEEIPETYRLLSPIVHVGPHCPPTLFLHGGDDVFGLTPGVRRLHQELSSAGVRSILVEFPHTDHAFDLVLPQVSPVAQAAAYDAERFLALLI